MLAAAPAGRNGSSSAEQTLVETLQGGPPDQSAEAQLAAVQAENASLKRTLAQETAKLEKLRAVLQGM